LPRGITGTGIIEAQDMESCAGEQAGEVAEGSVRQKVFPCPWVAEPRPPPPAARRRIVGPEELAPGAPEEEGVHEARTVSSGSRIAAICSTVWKNISPGSKRPPLRS